MLVRFLCLRTAAHGAHGLFLFVVLDIHSPTCSSHISGASGRVGKCREWAKESHEVNQDKEGDRERGAQPNLNVCKQPSCESSILQSHLQ